VEDAQIAKSDSVFVGSIPDVYDEYLVPLIFEKYVQDMLRRVAAQRPKTVLETAAGSGVVTRHLSRNLPAEVTLAITDLNQQMLDRNAKQLPSDQRVRFQQADAMNLPYDTGQFDVVCCQFGVMFFPDRIAGYREARRVLKPGGHFIFNAWDRIEENAFAHSVTQSLSMLHPEDPPIFMARTPHGYHDVARIRADVTAAGFGKVTVETLADVSFAPSARNVAIAFCEGTPLRNELEARGAGALTKATARAEKDISEIFGNGPVEGKMQAHIVVAQS
jgi:SAM-dependent methyltransferase